MKWRCRACGCVYEDTSSTGWRVAHRCGLVHPSHPLASTTEGKDDPMARVAVKGARDESLVLSPGPGVDYPVKQEPHTIRDEGMGRDQVEEAAPAGPQAGP